MYRTCSCLSGFTSQFFYLVTCCVWRSTIGKRTTFDNSLVKYQCHIYSFTARCPPFEVSIRQLFKFLRAMYDVNVKIKLDRKIRLKTNKNYVMFTINLLICKIICHIQIRRQLGVKRSSGVNVTYMSWLRVSEIQEPLNKY